MGLRTTLPGGKYMNKEAMKVAVVDELTRRWEKKQAYLDRRTRYLEGQLDGANGSQSSKAESDTDSEDEYQLDSDGEVMLDYDGNPITQHDWNHGRYHLDKPEYDECGDPINTDDEDEW